MIVPLPRMLGYGRAGRDVLAVQRALAHAGVRRWGHFSGRYGVLTVRHVKEFQRRHGIGATGIYGPATHRVLARYFDRYGASLMLKKKHKVAVLGRKKRGKGAAVAAAWIAYNNRGVVHYTQGSARMMIVRSKIRDLARWFHDGHSLYEDCSSSITGFHFIGNLPDPNGRRFSGEGYTGTMAVNGTRVYGSAYELCDFALYGWAWPYRHVVMYVGGGRWMSHGSERGPYPVALHYRADFSHVRRISQ